LSVKTRQSAIGMTLVMCLAEICSMSGFSAYTTLLPQFQREWSLTNSAAGLIGGFVFAGYMCAVPILTALTDRCDSRKVYAGACFLSAFGALGFTLFAQGLMSALLFQFFIGAGLGGTYMPGLKTLTDHLEGASQARATAFYAGCFGFGSSLSIAVCGALATYGGWRAAFIFATLGPVVAAVLVNVYMPKGQTQSLEQSVTSLLNFTPALAQPTTRYYILGYAIHNFELFGHRSWMVAFLAFSLTLQPSVSTIAWGAASLGALINLSGPLMSILGNEFALRIGRSKVIYFFMALSGLGACCLGFTAGLPIAVVFVLMFIHYGLMLGDSATLTAGAIGSAPTHLRGSVLAIYSFVGFSAALVAPITFGLVLDYAGGNQSTQAWGLAFMSIGVFGALSPLARWGFKRFS